MTDDFCNGCLGLLLGLWGLFGLQVPGCLLGLAGATSPSVALLKELATSIRAFSGLPASFSRSVIPTGWGEPAHEFARTGVVLLGFGCGIGLELILSRALASRSERLSSIGILLNC